MLEFLPNRGLTLVWRTIVFTCAPLTGMSETGLYLEMVIHFIFGNKKDRLKNGLISEQDTS
jgi:hypothetical protein